MNQLPPLEDYQDPVQYLRATHGVILKQVRELEKLLDRAEANGVSESFHNEPAWKDVFHFFARSAPQHEQDEEEALFPIVRERVPKIGFQLPNAPIHFLTQGHETLQGRVEELVNTWRKFKEGTEIDLKSFIAVARELVRLYQEHIKLEEETVYKIANDVLTPYERVEILRLIRENHSHRLNMQAPTFSPPSVSGSYNITMTPKPDEDE